MLVRQPHCSVWQQNMPRRYTHAHKICSKTQDRLCCCTHTACNMLLRPLVVMLLDVWSNILDAPLQLAQLLSGSKRLTGLH